jgi:hypothetical protein
LIRSIRLHIAFVALVAFLFLQMSWVGGKAEKRELEKAGRRGLAGGGERREDATRSGPPLHRGKRGRKRTNDRKRSERRTNGTEKTGNCGNYCGFAENKNEEKI